MGKPGPAAGPGQIIPAGTEAAAMTDLAGRLAALWDALGAIPAGRCARYTPALVRHFNLADLGFGVAYALIPAMIAAVAWRRRRELPFPGVAWLFFAFIVLCGATHALKVATGFRPDLLWAAALVSDLGALVSFYTVYALYPVARQLLAAAGPAELASFDSALKAGGPRIRVGGAFLAAALLVAGSGAFAWRAATDLAAQTQARRRAYVEAVALGDFLQAVTDAETGQRGYLMTGGDPTYLGVYARALGEHAAAARALRAAGMPPADLAALEAPVAAKLAELARTVALARGGDLPRALAVVATHEGRDRMADLRAAVVARRRDRDAEGDARQAAVLAAAARTKALIPLAGGVAGLALAAAACAVVFYLEDRRRLVARLAAANAELARSNAELQQFAFAASHDLQEPLRMIRSFTQLLERKLPRFFDPAFAGPERDELAVKAGDWMNRVVDGAERMQALIAGILEYSRVTTRAKPMEPVDLGAALAQALKDLEPAIAGCGAIITADPLPTVPGDAGQLARVLVNLLGNAVKYRRPGYAPRVAVTAADLGGSWEVAVADDGPGIPPEYREKAFELFTRLGAGGTKGSGVGLALCRKVVERHGGRIWADQTPGGGATFKFTLPKGPR